eukprot:CFRG7964T1
MLHFAPSSNRVGVYGLSAESRTHITTPTHAPSKRQVSPTRIPYSRPKLNSRAHASLEDTVYKHSKPKAIASRHAVENDRIIVDDTTLCADGWLNGGLAVAALSTSFPVEQQTHINTLQTHGIKCIAGDGLVNVQNSTYIDGRPHVLLPALQKLDLESVDLILCSNWHSCLALPFITEYTGFKGSVYATEPTRILAKQVMLEMAVHNRHLPLTGNKNVSAEAIHYMRKAHGISWSRAREIYSSEDVVTCVERMIDVSFNQPLTVAGVLTLTATSAGHSIGSSCWTLQTGGDRSGGAVRKSTKTTNNINTNATTNAALIANSEVSMEKGLRASATMGEKIVYMPACSLNAWSHPLPFDPSPLLDCDVLLMAGISPVDQGKSLPYKDMVLDVLREAAATVSNNGSVLLPIHPSGNLTVLLELLHKHLNTIGKEGIPFYVVSPYARPSALYSNIFTEWLSKHKADKVFTPDYPFMYDELIQQKRLHFISSLGGPKAVEQIRGPCVIFAGHPSLRLGDVVDFVRDLGTSPRNLIICTEPEYTHQSVIGPYLPLACRVKYCPMDMRLNIQDASALLAEHAPPLVLLPKTIKEANPNMVNPLATEVLALDSDIPIKLSVSKLYRSAAISTDLAALTKPVTLGNGDYFTPISGVLSVHNNENILKVDEDTINKSADERVWDKSRHVVGYMSVDNLCSALTAELPGSLLVKAHATQKNTKVLVMEECGITIQLGQSSTHVFINDDNEITRRKVKAILLRHLKQV